MKTSQCCFIVLSGDLDHPIVFCDTSLGQFDAVFIQDCIKIVWKVGAVAELLGIEGGVVSGLINLESSDVEASDWRPRHDEHYHEV